MGSSLIRGPTITPDNTAPTLSAAGLKLLDAAYLPWSVETFEEQMLLSSICEVRYVGAGEVQDSFKFVVWSCNPHYGAGSDSEEDDDDEMESDESDHDPDKDDNIDDAEQGQEPTHDSKRQKESDAPPEEHPSLDFEPLPAGTRFHWLRLRHVHVSKLPGTMFLTFTCSCGFFGRIGTACRHVFRALRFVLESFREDDSSDDDTQIFAEINFVGFFRLDWCSKIRYHSIIFNAPLPPAGTNIPHCFLQSLTLLENFVEQAQLKQLKTPTIAIHDGKKIYSGVPKEGLPADCEYESKQNGDDDASNSEREDQDNGGEGAVEQQRSLRFTPTNANAENMLSKMLHSVGKNTAARAYLGAQLLTMQAEIARIVQPKAKPSDLRRHFSQSDYANGRTRPQSKK